MESDSHESLMGEMSVSLPAAIAATLRHGHAGSNLNRGGSSRDVGYG